MQDEVNQALTTLSNVPPGADARLVRVDGGRGLVARLAAMGLVPGVAFRVLTNAGRGPFVILVRGSRIVLGRGVAQRIHVTTA